MFTSQKQNTRRRLLSAAALSGLPLSFAVQAQNRGGLYDPEPPADSSYVRIVVLGADGPLDVVVDQKIRSPKLAVAEVSDYLVLQGGKRQIAIHQAGKQAALTTYEIDLPKGKAITLAFMGLKPGQAPTQFEDKANTNKLKAVLAAYHLDSKAGALDVLTADGNTKVFQNLAFGASNAIQVNPISVDLIAAKTGTTNSQLPGAANLNMTQGATYSVFLMPDSKGKLHAKVLQNKTERYVAKS